jgi:hypothetical protein
MESIAVSRDRQKVYSLCYHPAMTWIRTLHQKLSFKLGFAHGQRGWPFKCPWWIDTTTYAIGHIDGQEMRAEGLRPRINS